MMLQNKGSNKVKKIKKVDKNRFAKVKQITFIEINEINEIYKINNINWIMEEQNKEKGYGKKKLTIFIFFKQNFFRF